MEDQKKHYLESELPDIHVENRKILNEYLLFLQQKQRSKSTITTYKWMLEQFLRKCWMPLKELTEEEISKCLKDYSTNKSESTIALYISTLSNFFRFCQEGGYMENILIQKHWKPKVPPSPPRYLTNEEFARVIETAKELSPRDKAITLLLFFSGCKGGEICRLLIKDIDLKNRIVKVKSNNLRLVRSVHFTRECELVLEKYLKTRISNPDDPLFVSHSGKLLRPNTLYLFTRKLGEKAGLKQPLTPNVCRHTFAKKMYDIGTPLEIISVMLGSVNINTVLKYAK